MEEKQKEMTMIKNNRLFVDIHAIQTLPPSNINRDDTGSPKTAQYGGVARSRVSSQSWKKAMRDYFNENSSDRNIGIRSLEVVKYLANAIISLDSSLTEEEALKLAEQTMNKAGIKTTKDKKVKALFFIGEKQALGLAEAALKGLDDKKELQNILKDNPSIDIALFGRMVADDPSLNEDASSQVAHSISTHAVQTEFDFFTAVDDLAPEDNAGAGMLGTIEFNSSTLYRYANVAIHEFYSQLGDREATIATLKLFIEAFILSLPTGKINTFANQTLPQAILISVRNDRPVNLVSAFEDPVKSKEGYVKRSVDKLIDEYKKVQKIVSDPVFTLYLGLEEGQGLDDSINEMDNLKELLDEFELRTNGILE